MHNRPQNFVVVTLVAVPLLLLTAGESAHAQLEVIVPAYFYPVNSSPWDDLNTASSQVDITAIMNPASGSGVAQDQNYVAVVDALRAAGGTVVGYVPTTFGQRPLADVQADIDNYYDWYNVDGIFIDEMSNTGPASRIGYYQDIYAYVKAMDASDQVIGNPGTNTLEQYLNFPGGPTADTLVITENIGSAYASYSPSAWTTEYDRSNFAHLIHTEASSATALDDLELALQRNAGSIYITDDVLTNPWDRLPTYWQAKVDAIEQINNAILSGDFDENGTVNDTDLTRWVNGVGITNGATKFQGDSNEDGDSDGRDFLQWQEDFGQTTVPLTLAESLAAQNVLSIVPEPSSVVLLILGSLLGYQSLRRSAFALAYSREYPLSNC